jgi:hypothetical protein
MVALVGAENGYDNGNDAEVMYRHDFCSLSYLSLFFARIPYSVLVGCFGSCLRVPPKPILTGTSIPRLRHVATPVV